MMVNNKAIGRTWEEAKKELFTQQEIAEGYLRVAIMQEIIEARKKKGITQKQLEEISGVKQPVISRLEKGNTNTQIATALKVLAPLGMTLKVVPLPQSPQSPQR